MNNVAGIGAELAVASEAPGVIAVGRRFSTAATRGAGVLQLLGCVVIAARLLSQQNLIVYLESFCGQTNLQ